MRMLYHPDDTEDYGRQVSIPAALRIHLGASFGATYKIYPFGEMLRQEFRRAAFNIYFLQFIVKKQGYIYMKWDKPRYVLQYILTSASANIPVSEGTLPLNPGTYGLHFTEARPQPLFLNTGLCEYLMIEFNDTFLTGLNTQSRSLVTLFQDEKDPSLPFQIPINYLVAEAIRKIRLDSGLDDYAYPAMSLLINRLLELYVIGMADQKYLQQLPEVLHKPQLIMIRNDILYAPHLLHYQLSPLSRQYFLSKSQLWKSFQALFKVSLGVFVERTCMEKAHLLLTTTNLSLSEIALGIGYQYERNFTRAFKRWYGILPSALRAQRASFPTSFFKG